MLGVFRTKLVEQNPEKQSALDNGLLEKYFHSCFSEFSIVNFGMNGFISSTNEQVDHVPPLSENLPFPAGMYSNANHYCVARSSARLQLDTVSADYNHAKTLWNGNPYQYIRLRGRKYNGIFYDNNSSVNPENTHTHALVVNCLIDVPMLWGIDKEGSIIVTDVPGFVIVACGRNYTSMSAGTCMLVRVPVSAAPPPSGSSGDSN